MKISRGTIKRLHVNQQVIARNRKLGTNNPPLTIQTSRGPIPANEAAINGPSRLIYSPHKPLRCGARLWIETRAEVEVLP
jgi:hypothetical protein